MITDKTIEEAFLPLVEDAAKWDCKFFGKRWMTISFKKMLFVIQEQQGQKQSTQSDPNTAQDGLIKIQNTHTTHHCFCYSNTKK